VCARERDRVCLVCVRACSCVYLSFSLSICEYASNVDRVACTQCVCEEGREREIVCVIVDKSVCVLVWGGYD